MKFGKNAIGLLGETIWARIRKFSRLFSGKSRGPVVVDKSTSTTPINPGRGNIRWKDYHPNPPVSSRASNRPSNGMSD